MPSQPARARDGLPIPTVAQVSRAGRPAPVPTAHAARTTGRARDEEAAERLAVRLVLPLGACHLPAFVILGIAPVVASVGMGMITG